jgi:hypothetical protein
LSFLKKGWFFLKKHKNMARALVFINAFIIESKVAYRIPYIFVNLVLDLISAVNSN